MTKGEWYKQLFERLYNSKFRSSFHLRQKDIDYINEKGLDTIRQHETATCCRECIRKWHKMQPGREVLAPLYVLPAPRSGGMTWV